MQLTSESLSLYWLLIEGGRELELGVTQCERSTDPPHGESFCPPGCLWGD